MTSPSVAEPEVKRLEAIASRRTSLFRVAQIATLLALGAVASRRVIGERYDVLALILGIGLMAGVIGVLIYLTCFQRCPRCAGWIVIPKCPACGLKLDGSRKGASTDRVPGA
jgi:hypothetical protein